MADWNRVLKKLSVVLPAGAFGASVLLALAASDASAASNSNPQINTPEPEQSISARLQTIRAGVSDMSGSASFDAEGDARATPARWINGGWGNGGWGRWGAGWGNGGLGWRNGGWGNGWHNGGWGNGGWGNGGWHNGWHNFWHNW
jgi:rSAM-associated Gly-rich repeat protein